MKSEKGNTGNRDTAMPRSGKHLTNDTNEKKKGKTLAEKKYVETDEKSTNEPKNYLH